MTEFVVSSVQFLGDAIELTYMRLPEDIRNEGQLMATHSFRVVQNHPSYADEIQAVQDSVNELLADLYEDFDSAPVVAVPDDDDDDEEGMGG